MNKTWIVTVDRHNVAWVLQVVPASKIGPFKSVRDAEAARQELAAAAGEKTIN